MIRWLNLWRKKPRHAAAPRDRSFRLLVEMLEERCVPTTFVVTNTLDSGPGSLRDAILQANNDAGPDEIHFQIPGPGRHSIRLTSALPDIVNPLVLDGTTQPGYAGIPVIELVGRMAGANVNGLVLEGGESVVQGLMIDRFNGAGILVTGAGGNLIQSCAIGTDGAGDINLGNSNGIVLSDSSNNTIGGLAVQDGNVIAFSDGDGVQVLGNDSTGNAILSNSIFADGNLGIELGGGGVTPNDLGGPHGGPNHLMNYPDLDSAKLVDGNLEVDGSLDSIPNTTFLIQFFSGSGGDATGFGEGQNYLDSIQVTTDLFGQASFSWSGGPPQGQFVTATATDPNHNTSEFSNWVGLNKPVLGRKLPLNFRDLLANQAVLPPPTEVTVTPQLVPPTSVAAAGPSSGTSAIGDPGGGDKVPDTAGGNYDQVFLEDTPGGDPAKGVVPDQPVLDASGIPVLLEGNQLQGEGTLAASPGGAVPVSLRPLTEGGWTVVPTFLPEQPAPPGPDWLLPEPVSVEDLKEKSQFKNGLGDAFLHRLPAPSKSDSGPDSPPPPAPASPKNPEQDEVGVAKPVPLALATEPAKEAATLVAASALAIHPGEGDSRLFDIVAALMGVMGGLAAGVMATWVNHSKREERKANSSEVET